MTNQYIPYSNKTKPVIKVYNTSLILRITKYYFLYLSRFIFRISPPLSYIVQHQPLCLPFLFSSCFFIAFSKHPFISLLRCFPFLLYFLTSFNTNLFAHFFLLFPFCSCFLIAFSNYPFIPLLRCLPFLLYFLTSFNTNLFIHLFCFFLFPSTLMSQQKQNINELRESHLPIFSHYQQP